LIAVFDVALCALKLFDDWNERHWLCLNVTQPELTFELQGGASIGRGLLWECGEQTTKGCLLPGRTYPFIERVSLPSLASTQVRASAGECHVMSITGER
jgi:hypothetical protein